MRPFLLLLTTALATGILSSGCAMDVAVDAAALEALADVEVVELDLARLAALPAGCEGRDGSVRALARPGLGVLLGPDGEALCVDSLSLLLEEDDERRYVHALRADPTPTPLLPGRRGAEPDPTPTPLSLP